jgi:hypothetical protein
VQLRIVATLLGHDGLAGDPKLAIATLATGSTAVLLLALLMLVLDAGLLLSRLLRWPRIVSACAPRSCGRGRPAGPACERLWHQPGHGGAQPRQIDVAIKDLPAAFDGYACCS